MQRAGYQRSSSFRASTSPAAQRVIGVHLRLLEEPVLPVSTEVDPVCGDGELLGGARQPELEVAIRQRIESRLPGRVRNLDVRAYGDVVLLNGQCATYYTKQLAQHAAMGILEDEHLENAIVVNVVQ